MRKKKSFEERVLTRVEMWIGRKQQEWATAAGIKCSIGIGKMRKLVCLDEGHDLNSKV